MLRAASRCNYAYFTSGGASRVSSSTSRGECTRTIDSSHGACLLRFYVRTYVAFARIGLSWCLRLTGASPVSVPTKGRSHCVGNATVRLRTPPEVESKMAAVHGRRRQKRREVPSHCCRRLRRYCLPAKWLGGRREGSSWSSVIAPPLLIALPPIARCDGAKPFSC